MKRREGSCRGEMERKQRKGRGERDVKIRREGTQGQGREDEAGEGNVVKL